jgi:hypothetical protein
MCRSCWIGAFLVNIERIKAILSNTTCHHAHIRDECISDLVCEKGNWNGCLKCDSSRRKRVSRRRRVLDFGDELSRICLYRWVKLPWHIEGCVYVDRWLDATFQLPRVASSNCRSQPVHTAQVKISKHGFRRHHPWECSKCIFEWHYSRPGKVEYTSCRSGSFQYYRAPSFC